MKIQKQPAQPQITLVCIEQNLNVPSTFLLNAHFGFPLFSFCVFLYLCEWGPEAVCVGHGTSGSSLTERGTVAGMWLFLLLLLGQLVGTGVHVICGLFSGGTLERNRLLHESLSDLLHVSKKNRVCCYRGHEWSWNPKMKEEGKSPLLVGIV